jgi:phosphatidylinositol-3,4,5-trisphosphate 3-phosphatase/dual-specificity protein phosphatase PTEN
VLHCKGRPPPLHSFTSGSETHVGKLAGKGRSGTLACAYLLSLCLAPSKSMASSSRSHEFSEWSILGAKEGLPTPSSDDRGSAELQLDVEVGETGPDPSTSGRRLAGTSSVHPNAELAWVSSEPSMITLEQVLDLHRSRRMKTSSKHLRRSLSTSTAKKPKMGVSIPSQQRWLFYWSQVLQGKDPASFRLSTGKDSPEGHETPLTSGTRSPRSSSRNLLFECRGCLGYSLTLSK